MGYMELMAKAQNIAILGNLFDKLIHAHSTIHRRTLNRYLIWKAFVVRMDENVC